MLLCLNRQTEPEAFFLDVYFNAYSIQPQNQDSQEKRVVKNALAPTRIAYGGGQNEFTVDMGAEVRMLYESDVT
jgi:hypothetical protein